MVLMRSAAALMRMDGHMSSSALIFERAEKHYDVKIIMMNIVLTYLSFCVFLLDPKDGESGCSLA